MDRFGDLDIFARVVAAGSMSQAGRETGLSPAVISKRIRRLEERLGVRLLQRTTRQLALTEAGQGFHERVVGILAAIEEAESEAGQGAAEARGLLRISAPTSFGRLHIAPFMQRFLDAHPAVSLDMTLTDAFVDIIGEGYDLAIRIADLGDSSLIARRLAPAHRVLCAAPSYVARAGMPKALSDLADHALLIHNASEWRMEGPEGPATVRVTSRLRTNSSEVVREAVLAGGGIALRSTWDVGPELKSGALVRVLPQYGSSARLGVHALYPSRRHVEQKLRVFIEFLQALYGPTPYWDAGLDL
jgi:DNA-binding transcriptional LysR family regulator